MRQEGVGGDSPLNVAVVRLQTGTCDGFAHTL